MTILITNFTNINQQIMSELIEEEDASEPKEDIPVVNNNYIISHVENYSKDIIYTCQLCKISATSNKVLQRHYEGRKHKLRAEREGKTFACEICDLTANSQKQLDNHLKSTRHKYRLQKKDYDEYVKINGSKAVWVILVGIFVLFINFMLFFRLCL